MVSEPLTKNKFVTSETIFNYFEFESEIDMKEAARGTEHQLANYDGEVGKWVRVCEVASAVRLLREKIDANPLYDHLRGQSLRDAIKSTVAEVFGGCEKEKQTSCDEARCDRKVVSDKNLQEKGKVLISPSQEPPNNPKGVEGK